ncbi:glutathione-dependent formaldehyde-activating enzyme [Mycena pura]|uniref:Glutathione-dependent formaldehyde-activating enzyme n=1 Tax=Mycena pura TaxID=153505 RepID=A0AAD6VLE2_9AGAR|nr:glutathione-dependent formaldehyde-activating enzyme [Mycena pura]
MSDSASLVEYRGNCHCGAFQFTFKSAELKPTPCDCGICSKNAYLWVRPAPNSFTVVKGDENTTLASYEFGNKELGHKFCPTCGTSVMGRFRQETRGTTVVLNARALRDVDFASLPQGENYKGSAIGPPYQPPEPVATGPVPKGSTVYNGSCHCGAVAYALLSPAKLTSALECNCSICWRDGALWTYPATANVTFRGLESATEYAFAAKNTQHGFCKRCGVAIYEQWLDDAKQTALNIRTFNNVDLSSMEIEKEDGWGELQPQYEVPA